MTLVRFFFFFFKGKSSGNCWRRRRDNLRKYWYVQKKGNREAIINGKAETDTGVFEETRRGIPVGTQRRFDVYKDVAENVPI